MIKSDPMMLQTNFRDMVLKAYNEKYKNIHEKLIKKLKS